MAAAVLFPPEIFVDHLLVAVRDAALRLPGSSVPYHRHARQAAALASADPNASDELVAAALLSGIGEVILTSFARHPAAADAPVATSDLHAAEVARSHLSLYFSDEVTDPIALLPRARRYVRDARKGPADAPTMSAFERARFESEPAAVDATTLAVIDERAGRDTMVCPPLDAHRDLLHRLCIGTSRPRRLRLIS
jgi:predicted HD phosphohydrolase